MPASKTKASAQRGPTIRISDLTDEDNARRFVDRNAEKVRFCPTSGGWLVYDGGRWRPDDTMEVERLARETIQWIGEQAARIRDRRDREDFEAAVRGFKRASAITGLIKLARSDARIVVTPSMFDRDHYALNVRSGTLDLNTSMLGAHRPEDHLSKIAPVDFDPAATCPLFERFMLQIMGGDPEMVAYLQRALGYSLSGDRGEQCLFLCQGDGDNGKSVLLETVQDILGDYAMVAPTHLLTAAGKNQHLTFIADLEGKRFVAISEPKDNRFDEETLKALTGIDAVRVNRMHGDSYQFHQTHKFFVATNPRPKVRETSHAIWKRIKLVPFAVKFTEAQQDKQLKEKLRAEFSGILNWLLVGYRQWREIGLAEPETIRRATSDYRDEMDQVAQFIAERCAIEDGARVPASQLHEGYMAWCRVRGIPQDDRLGMKSFKVALEQKGHSQKKLSTNQWIGLRMHGMAPGVSVGD